MGVIGGGGVVGCGGSGMLLGESVSATKIIGGVGINNCNNNNNNNNNNSNNNNNNLVGNGVTGGAGGATKMVSNGSGNNGVASTGGSGVGSGVGGGVGDGKDGGGDGNHSTAPLSGLAALMAPNRVGMGTGAMAIAMTMGGLVDFGITKETGNVVGEFSSKSFGRVILNFPF